MQAFETLNPESCQKSPGSCGFNALPLRATIVLIQRLKLET